ncbi:hypothetical protein Avbf_09236 [Armadillidium vulgare]|nr:hypothetical protein Avbf_09236 [Armadillidium vulgare]
MPITQHVGSISDSNTTKGNSKCPYLVFTLNTTARCVFKMAGPIPLILTNTSLSLIKVISFLAKSYTVCEIKLIIAPISKRSQSLPLPIFNHVQVISFSICPQVGLTNSFSSNPRIKKFKASSSSSSGASTLTLLSLVGPFATLCSSPPSNCPTKSLLSQKGLKCTPLKHWRCTFERGSSSMAESLTNYFIDAKKEFLS